MKQRQFRTARTIAAVLSAALIATGCTSDDGGETPSETPSASESPTASESASPSASPTPSESEEPSEEPTASESPSDEPSPSASPSPSESPTPTPTPSPTETGTASALSTAPAAYDTDASAFVADTTQTRDFEKDSACGVKLAADEEYVSCVKDDYRVDDITERFFAVMTTRSASGGVDVTVYDLTLKQGDASATWTSALRAQDLPGEVELTTLPWGGVVEPVFTVEVGAGVVEVVTTDATSARVAATITRVPGVELEFLAGRIIARDFDGGDDRISVYAPPSGSGGFAGTTISGAPASALPEHVALTVYSAWITGDRAAAAGLVEDCEGREGTNCHDVERALFDEVPQTADLFEMVGTTCPVEGGAYVCRFRRQFDGQVTTWDLRPVEGTLKVVRIRQNA